MFASVKVISICILLNLTTCLARSQQNEFQNENLPNPVKYFSVDQTKNDTRQQEPRLGLGFPIAYGTDLQGYNGGVGGVYSPLRIDLGGLVLGTVIGLGAVLIVPKLFHIFTPAGGHGPYSPAGIYGRSETETESSLWTGMARAMSQIDKTLAENNVDSSACMQRAICTYVQSYSTPATMDLVNATAGSSLMNFIVDGSKFKDAITTGKNGENCAQAYKQCPFSKDSIANGLQSVINNNNV